MPCEYFLPTWGSRCCFEGRIWANNWGNSSSGLLLYAALVDLLAEDFLSEEASRTLTKKDRITAFAFVILGGKTTPDSVPYVRGKMVKC